MKKILVLVEGPNDKLRLINIEDFFDSKKAILFPMEGDWLKSSTYFSNYEDKIKFALAKDKSHDFDDFDEIVQICDTDGCFINDSCVKSDLSIKKIEYGANYIKTRDLKSDLTCKHNKITNINNLLISNNIRLFYNSCNIDHVFDNVANLSKNRKNTLAACAKLRYDANNLKLIEELHSANASKTLDHKASWDYIKQGFNSLSRCSNVIIFLYEHVDLLKPDIKKKLLDLKDKSK